jgi:drug/metabolite transporter (DMT)-like permease
MGTLLLNKALLTTFKFSFPLLLTLLHMLTCSLLCGTLSTVRILQLERCQTRGQLSKVVLLSVVFCSTVVLNNVSLRYLPVSFNQAVSATTPAFTAVLTFFVQGKVESALTYLTLVPVVGGIVIASRFEPLFHALGFAACLAGTAIRALKSVLQVCLPHGTTNGRPSAPTSYPLTKARATCGQHTAQHVRK